MILAISVMSVMQTGLAQDAVDFFAQSVGNDGRVAFAAGDAAYVGRVDVEQHGHTLVDSAKYGERFERGRDIIGLVTIHDFL